MPALLSAATSCRPDHPCRLYDLCAGCQAELYLTSDDWTVISFYRRVSDQVDMNGNLQLTQIREAAAVYGYPEDMVAWLASSVRMLHGLLTKRDKVHWLKETGKLYRHVGPEDVCDG